MMGRQTKTDPRLFYYNINLENRVPAKHILRTIKETIDFDFVYKQVNDCYGHIGNVSVPPPVILKMMLLLFLYDVRSERELMETIPLRLDWLWFLGYDLDSDIPNHSVLSKARIRWGVDVFESLFAQVVGQCLLAGLVDGSKIHVDGSLIDANASNNSIVKGSSELIEQLRDQLRTETSKLDDPIDEPSNRPKKYYNRKNKGMVSMTDPDSAIVRQGKGQPRARYKSHRVVDDRVGVITAVETTSGDVEENSKLMDLVDQHSRNTDSEVDTVVADTQYGTADNFRQCHERQIRSHMGDLLAPQAKKGRREGIFGYDDFLYDARTDTYTCPAGQILTRRKHKKTRNAFEYACSKSICQGCHLRSNCTRAKHGAARTIKRHYNHEAVDAARKQSHSYAAKRDRRRRKWLMEGSFGDATTRHGFKRARWRRLWRQQIQDYLIATVQNIRILMRHLHTRPAQASALALINESLMDLSDAIVNIMFSIVGLVFHDIGYCLDSAWQKMKLQVDRRLVPVR